MRSQRYRQVRLTKKVEENRKHLLFSIVVLLEARQVEDLVELLQVVVREVGKEVVVVIADGGGQETVHLVVSNFDFSLNHGVPYDRLPDIIIVLVEMLDENGLVTALIAVIILEDSDEIARHELDGQVGILRLPLALIFSDRDVTAEIVVLLEHTLKEVNQVIQIFDNSVVFSGLTGFFINHPFVHLEQH